MKVLIFLLLLPLTSLATKVVGNGGDLYAIEFVDTAEEVYQYLQETGFDSINAIDLRTAISDTKVESTDKKLILNGTVKDAINYPALKKIIFNRLRWTNMTDKERAVLVLHEYLGLLGLENASYKYSKKLLAKMAFNRWTKNLKDSISVNFASSNEYSLDARLTVISTGVEGHPFNSEKEKVQLIVEAQGDRKLFNLPLRGRLISIWNANDDIDSGLYIKILQPIRSSSGAFEQRTEDEGFSIYIKHVVKEYLIQFKSKKAGKLPQEITITGPILNQAG